MFMRSAQDIGSPHLALTHKQEGAIISCTHLSTLVTFTTDLYPLTNGGRRQRQPERVQRDQDPGMITAVRANFLPKCISSNSHEAKLQEVTTHKKKATTVHTQ